MGGHLRPGVIFAGYRIARLLGAGGMGEVYLARDRDLPRFVALKVLNRVAGNEPEIRQRFQREADIVARLSHPNIVAIFARGEEEGQLWLSMTHVDGSDLAEELHDGPLDLWRAAAITADVAKALDHAHDAGVLHRDVKPANILLTANSPEWVLLTDFGIAKSVQDARGLTESAYLLASLPYAAPERFHGEAEVDRQSDVYSLGCTLFEMLTGTTPYADSDPYRLMYNHVNAPVPLPSALKPGLPAELDAIIARAMAKQPGDRFATCTELSEALTAAITAGGDENVSTPKPQPPLRQPEAADPTLVLLPRPGRAARRSFLAFVLVALLIGAGAAILRMLPSSTHTSEQPQTTTAATGSAADGCQSLRSPDVVSGTDPGGSGSGPDAILAFQYAYYVQRSGVAARQVTADDSTNVSSAAQIQSGIDTLPVGTRYCVQVRSLAPETLGGLDRWAVQVTEQRPGTLQMVYRQIVTTRRDGDRTVISSIAEGS